MVIAVQQIQRRNHDHQHDDEFDEDFRQFAEPMPAAADAGAFLFCDRKPEQQQCLRDEPGVPDEHGRLVRKAERTEEQDESSVHRHGQREHRPSQPAPSCERQCQAKPTTSSLSGNSQAPRCFAIGDQLSVDSPTTPTSAARNC